MNYLPLHAIKVSEQHFFLLIITELGDIPVKVNSAQQRHSEPSPPKTIFHDSENHLTCPSKHKRQRQDVKLERLVPLKKHEFKGKRQFRGASRKTILPSNLLEQRPGEEHLHLLCQESDGLLPLHDGRFSKWFHFSNM